MKYKIPTFLILLAVSFATIFSPDTQAANGPKFLSSYDKALAKGKETGKPIIVIFSASWCPPCQQMKKQVYPDKKVQPYHDAFVWAYLDADSSANGPAMKKNKTRGIPHVVFLNSSGKKVDELVGGVSAEKFATTLAGITSKKGEKKGSFSRR